jgi:hypothetical protein
MNDNDYIDDILWFDRYNYYRLVNDILSIVLIILNENWSYSWYLVLDYDNCDNGLNLLDLYYLIDNIILDGKLDKY